jgi:hypothetical protein
VEAHISTYGTEAGSTQHWQLFVDGLFIAETSVPEHLVVFQRIADVVNVGACTCQPYWPVGHPNHICTCGAFVSNSVESGGTANHGA